MRKFGFWMMVCCFPLALAYPTLKHETDTDLAISLTLGILAMIGFWIAFWPQKKSPTKLQAFKETDKMPMPVFNREVFHKKDFDLLITGVHFHKESETCYMKFLPADDNLDRVIHFHRRFYPYIYDQLLEFDGADLFPIMATITYSEKENAYYFKQEL